MRIINEQHILDVYKMEDAIRDQADMMKALSKQKVRNPLRAVIEFPEREASALYMSSADLLKGFTAVKAVTIFPQNDLHNLPTTQGVTLLSSAEDGRHLALLNATYLTRLRTGAVSALATDALARQAASVLAVIGTGAMAFEQVLGVAAVRPLTRIVLYNLTKDKALAFRERLLATGVEAAIEVVGTPSEAVAEADIINCATRATEPVFDGGDLKRGAHVNGVGSYLPHMKEIDETTILRASKIVVDDRQGAEEEAGELIHADRSGRWSFNRLYGELYEIVAGDKPGRTDEEEITFFKCVGTSYFDLAAAQGVYQKALALGVGINVEIE